MDTLTIRVWKNETLHTLAAKPGQTLLEALRENGLYAPAICGGRGTCGKCAVRITQNAPSASHADEAFFSVQALAEGGRLACTAPVEDGMEVVLYTRSGGNEQATFQVLDIYEPQEPLPCDRYPSDADGYGLAVDIGTTTVAFELLALSTGRRAGSYAAVNRQRALGADVITRIQQAGQGKLSELHAFIVEDIRRGITRVCETSGIRPDEISTIVIAGNTTMLHILMNVPVESLGRFPFTPVFTGMVRHPFAAIFGNDPLNNQPTCEVTLLPGISAYVGADITSGIIFCGGPHREKPCLLIDLGTNGEMALFSKVQVIVTSTAAGPAFEAGNISCGTGSVPGAIAKVSYQPSDGVYSYETIGRQPPVGLCGTGVVDTAAQLVAHGLVDETGLLAEEYFDDGVPVAPEAGIFFTQKDMREIQLAKSAVRSGLEVLLAAAGYGYGDIDRVFLAGGFGHKINLDSAQTLGIIPAELRARVVSVGNSALGGCARVLTGLQAEQDICAVAAMATEINLSADPRFNELFMCHMMFEEAE